MNKKGRCKSQKSKQKHKRPKESEKKVVLAGSSDSDEKSSDVERSRYSAKAVNCKKCLKSENKHTHSHAPDIKAMMDIFGEKPTVENFKRVLQVINELVDNYDISERITEMIQQGIEVILIQGMQFTNTTIQYYSIHGLSVIVKYMNETQLKNLMQCALLQSLAIALKSDTDFIVQEFIELCSSIAIKSIEMRDILVSFGTLHISGLLSINYQIISKEIAFVIAIFLRNLCYLKPVPEFILKHVTNGARYLLRHEDYEIRLAALNAILEVVSNREFAVIFDDAYIENILKFLNSPWRAEIKAAFNIASEFTRQQNCNTDKLIKEGFIGMIISILARNSTVDFGYDACSMLARILSNKKYVESVIESGLVLLLIGLMDEGTDSYKIKACKALTYMHSNLDRKNAIKIADQMYLEKLCNILTNDNNNCIACALALINSILEACSEEKIEGQLKQATKYIKGSEAYEHIMQYASSECYKVQNLAENVFHHLNDNVMNDRDEEVSQVTNF